MNPVIKTIFKDLTFSMIKLITYQLILTLILVGLSLSVNASNHLFILSLSLGSGWMLINWMILFWSWRQIFKKKLIALSIVIIVSKYAILGVFLFYIVSSSIFDIKGFLIGLSTILPTVIGYAWMVEKSQNPSLNESGF